ncbi:unnamed protein product, partial [Mesorhabditis belari]|uniref:Uncharacterized protein n=1 Tax=Mesorhabditis belari TaxID=2138241 RepID=A0AAF3FKC0_9BILA
MSTTSPRKQSATSWARKVALGTYQDPYNKPEHEHTLKGRELYLFVIFYTVCVGLIVLMFELCMPVLFNPNYPYPPDESPPK